jgi:tetratricopeptide (TPR) repeat protein
MHRTPLLSTWLLLLGLGLTSACASNEVAKQKYLVSGNRFFDQKDYRSAVIEYRNALVKDPQFAAARTKLAETYERLGDVPNAYREYVRSADLALDNDVLQVKAGEYLLLARRFEDAKTKALLVATRSPANVDAQILLGNALAGLNDLTGALEKMEEAASAHPPRSQPYTNVGYLQLARGKKAEAEQAFIRAIDVDRHSMPAYLALANFYVGDGRPADAELTLKQAIAIEPRNVLANRALAAFYVTANRTADAEPYLTMAAEVGGAASRLALADYYIMSTRDGDARAILERMAASPDTFAPATVRLADIAYRDGRVDQAHAALADVLRRDPKNTTALFTKGRFLLAEKHVPEAIVEIKAGISADPQSVAGHVLLANAYRTSEDFEAAIKEYNEVLKLSPRSAVAQYELARLHLATGRSATSVQFAEAAVRSEPQSGMARLVFARALTVRREFGRAEAELRILQQGSPKSSVVHSAMGTLFLATGKIAGARPAFEEALTLDPLNLEACGGLVQLDLAAKRFDDVRQRLDERVALTPDNPEVLVFAATGYTRIGEAAKVETLLRQVIDADPARLRAYVMLGQFYYAQNRLEEAKKELRTVMSRKPDAVGVSTLLGVILQIQGNTAEAEQAYQSAMDSDPYAAVAANNLAWLYAASGKNLDIALQLAQTARSRLVGEPNVSDTLGWIYYKKGLFRQAVSAFEESIAKNPASAEFQFHLGLAHMKAGNANAAKVALNQALRLDPKFEGAEEAKKALEGLGN